MIEVKDQMNSVIRLGDFPSRIISLVPSQTQLLHYLGLENEVVGITKFCIHPDEWFRSKTRVGGTKTVKFDEVYGLKPDLIIGNKEENQKEDIERLKKIAPVWMSDIYHLDDSFEMMLKIGELTNKSTEANTLVNEIKSEFQKLDEVVKKINSNSSVLYCIWNEPLMVAGKNTFVDDMLSRCGLINSCEIERYPDVSNSDLNPDFVFLSSEPYPFSEKHISELQIRYPKAKIVLVDGEMFSWYGSKLKEAPAYFADLLNSIY